MAEGGLPIDVVIPAWGARYASSLAATLSTTSQAARRIVVADEGCADIARAHGAECVIPLERRSVGASREQALSVAVHPFILFLDADDRLNPGALRTLHEALRCRPDAVASIGFLARGGTTSVWPSRTMARLACSSVGLHALLFRNLMPAVGACLIRREKVRGRPLFPPCQDEDWHAAIRLRGSGEVILVARPLVHYHVSAGSRSRRPRSREALEASRRACCQLRSSLHRGGR
jgi:glycosyltransferase involved in cell wall biosynthesis